MSGWIKIYREMQRHWIWDNPVYLKGWLTILLNVNFEDKKVLIGAELVECKAGEAVYSLQSWTKLLGKGWTIQKTRTFFTLLKDDEMIVTKGMQKSTRLTVCNYELYQLPQQASNKLATSKQQASNKLATTTKEYKEVKKGKNSIGTFVPPTISEIKKRMDERKLTSFTAEAFHAHYTANGWMVGRNKMKNWNAALTTWNEKSKSYGANKQNHSGQIKNVNDKWR